MNYTTILASKATNTHHLTRYCKFIAQCVNKNTNNKIDKLYRHHICPKAADMFPEYISFSKHPWNCAKLTSREHFIAHLMLTKVFGVKSQFYAFNQLICMSGGRNSKKYSKFLEYFTEILKEDIKTKPNMGRKGWRWIFNTVTEKFSHLGATYELPIDCILKNPPGKKQPEYIETYHNPITQKEYKIDIRYPIPEGMVKGRSDTSREYSRKNAIGNSGRTGLLTYHCRETGKQYYLDPNSTKITELGLVKGSSDEVKKSISNFRIASGANKGSRNPAYGTTTFHDQHTQREYKIKLENVQFAIESGLIRGRSPKAKQRVGEAGLNNKVTIIFSDNSKMEFRNQSEFSKWSSETGFIVNSRFFNAGKITIDQIKRKAKMYLLGAEVIVEPSKPQNKPS